MWRVAVGLAVICAPAYGRELTSASDPALSGSVEASFMPPAGPPEDVTTWELVAGGVTFTFTSLGSMPEPLLIDAGSLPYIGMQSWDGGSDPATQGVALSISPPVSAIGFDGYGIVECPQATFSGLEGFEAVDVADQTGNCYSQSHFFGAAEIGDIGAVVLQGEGAIYTMQRVVFIPVGPSASGDVSVAKSTSAASAVESLALAWDLEVHVDGTDPATNVVVRDFLPETAVYESSDTTAGTLTEDDVDADESPEIIRVVHPSMAGGGSFFVGIDATTPGRDQFTCGDAILNLALVGAAESDPDTTDNLAVAVTTFDEGAVAAAEEVCDNGIDDDCDGTIDCGSEGCPCRPTLPPAPGAADSCIVFTGVAEAIVVLGAFSGDCPAGPAEGHACTVPRGVCGGVTVPPFCCDPATWSDPANNLTMSDCDVGVPGCVPRDPNWKDAVPGVDLWGYGYTAAGEDIAYTIHYENVGNADAHDVVVVDALDPDLDASTLVIDDGGTWDADTRTITWTDPVVPPATPRTVSYTVAVRSDAEPGTRVRNVATVVFPDAVPPTRIDTNFVEHAIPYPTLDLAPDFSIAGCEETSAGSGEWHVKLLNDGPGFAYGVTARLLDREGLHVTDNEVAFGHPDDPSDDSVHTVIPFAVTTSLDTVSFESEDDPCADLTWRIEWDNLLGDEFTFEVGPNADNDPGCNCSGCSTTGGPGGLPGVLAALLALRRRRPDGLGSIALVLGRQRT